MNIDKFCELETRYCKDMNIHVVCLMCQFRCKDDYSLWTGCMPPREYCEHYEPHEYWIAIIKMAGELDV